MSLCWMLYITRSVKRRERRDFKLKGHRWKDMVLDCRNTVRSRKAELSPMMFTIAWLSGLSVELDGRSDKGLNEPRK